MGRTVNLPETINFNEIHVGKHNSPMDPSWDRFVTVIQALASEAEESSLEFRGPIFST